VASGTAPKEAIHEPVGDGITSALDLELDVQCREGKGDRAVVTWSGESLPCEEGWPLAGRPA
jgi:cyanate lyase